MTNFQSTKVIELGSCAFRQPMAKSHCRFIHGYRLTAKFWFGCNELDENNWCIDFGGLKGLKDKLQQHFDHTTIISKHDPFLDDFNDLNRKGVIDLRIDDGVGIEMFAKKCFDIADIYISAMTNDRCNVEKVEVWEHESNSATYTNKHVQSMTFKEEESKEENKKDEFQPITPENTPAIKDETRYTKEGLKINPDGSIPAAVGNKVSQGLGDMFGGTSWSTKSGDSMR
jgi:6-pyruvoyltetrahydropterin/6-carboxytetrahydropterin synthase